MSFFRKAGNDINSAFSKGAVKNTLRKMDNTYQASIPAVKTIGNLAGTLAPAALMIPGYGPSIAVGMKGANAMTNAYAMGAKPKSSIQASKTRDPQQANIFH